MMFSDEHAQAILNRLESLETMLVAALGRRPPDRSIVTWREAARVLGIGGARDPARAAARRLKRLVAKPDGPSLRLYRTGVNRGDLERWVESSGKPSTSEIIRSALAPRRRGRR